MRGPCVMAAVVMCWGLAVSRNDSLRADEPPLDTKLLRDLAATRNFSLGQPSGAKPTPDGKAVLFLRSPARAPVMHLYEFNVATKATRVLLTPEQLLKGVEEVLSPEEKARRERMRVSTRGFTSFQLSPDGSLVLVSLSGKLYTFARADGKVQELPTGKGTLLDPKFSPDGKSLSYVLDQDVYVLDLATKKETRVTTGGTADVTHGLAEFVAQEEMSRFTGYWWSPDSQWIAYEEADNRGVEVWRVSDPAKPGQEPHEQHYPRPGKNNTKVRLGVISAGGGETVWVDWDRERYPYLATVKWDKGGPLTLLVQTRNQQEETLLSVDPKTGKTTTLLVEKDDAWLNLDQGVPKWLEDGSGFLWSSERGGRPTLELRDASGQLVRELFPPKGKPNDYEQLVSVDEKERQAYVVATVGAVHRHVFRVSLDGDKVEPLTHEPGLHGATFAKNHAIYVRHSSGPKTMSRATVHLRDGTEIGELPSVAEAPPFVPRYEIVPVTATVRLGRATSGSPILQAAYEFPCSITRPRDFDPKKRYPVILEVYAGPGAQVVLDTMGGKLLSQWRADQGFIVVSFDNRGTPGQGRDWERVLRGSFSKVPLTDQVAALQAAGKQFPEMDLSRVGVVGWSFGGYFSALAVLRRPDVFKAAVAGAPVSEWLDYDTHYTERYLGLPQENPEGYKESSLLTYAADLKRPLLLIHGTSDDNVFFLHTLKLSEALFRAGKPHEVLPLSGFTHMVPDPTVKERLEERIIRFFQKHL